MSVNKKRRELERIQGILEGIAAELPDLTLSVSFIVQMKPPKNRVFSEPNRVILLWQYYGRMDLIKRMHEQNIMFVKLDSVEVPGTLSLDGYVGARNISPAESAELILTRAKILV